MRWLGVARHVAAASVRSWAPWPGQGLPQDWSPQAQSRDLSHYRISKPSGAIMPRPVTMPFGLIRVFSVVITFVCFGTYVSKTFAAFLDEYNVDTNPEFPEDDL